MSQVGYFSPFPAGQLKSDWEIGRAKTRTSKAQRLKNYLYVVLPEFWSRVLGVCSAARALHGRILSHLSDRYFNMMAM